MKTNKKQIFILFIPLLIIMLISFLNMYNAPLLDKTYEYNLVKQIIWYIVGFIILFILTKINLKNIFNYSLYFYIFTCLLLLLVLFIGTNINGARAWFTFKFFSFQPSELMKLSLALYLTNIAYNTKITNLKEEFYLIIKFLIITLIPSILVFLEPDTGAIIFYLVISLSILFIKHIHKFWFFILLFLIMVILLIFILFYKYNPDFLIKVIGTSFFYRIERLITFQNASSYQLENALIAIGSASLWGVGLKKSSLYIPEAPTDFIFAFTISNYGIITGLIVLLSYFIIDIYLINTYFKIKNKKIKLFLFSFLSVFIFQQVINLSMNLGLIPIIGIPLPFLSYGGSTIIIYFIFLGIILNFVKKDKKQIFT